MILRMRGLALILSLTLVAPAFAGSEPSRLTAAARDQVGVTVTYDPGYAKLEFPGGDIPRDRGVCTDVVIRALRDGWRHGWSNGTGAAIMCWAAARMNPACPAASARNC